MPFAKIAIDGYVFSLDAVPVTPQFFRDRHGNLREAPLPLSGVDTRTRTVSSGDITIQGLSSTAPGAAACAHRPRSPGATSAPSPSRQMLNSTAGPPHWRSRIRGG